LRVIVDTPVVMRGVSAALRGIEDEIEHAAGVPSPILLTGEDGVGKTLVAHLIHQQSPRAAEPLVMTSCAGVPEPALESQLFGPVADAGSALDDTQGWLQAADGGTIFIDDVGEMSLRMQAMLLPFLETGELPRV
jgi:anaerobic nitric oxide reductase transcription regulator